MFQLLVSISRQELAVRQLPAFLVSFVVASLFYRFGSFALECIAFLATWFVVDAAAQLVVNALPRSKQRPAPGTRPPS